MIEKTDFLRNGRTKAMKKIEKPYHLDGRADGLASILTRLSLVGLLPSRAQLRFTKFE